MDLNNRKIAQFRCHIDPMIPPKPRQSFDKRELPNWDFEYTDNGVYVKSITQVPGSDQKVFEFLIPFANVQSIRFEPVEPKADRKKDH